MVSYRANQSCGPYGGKRSVVPPVAFVLHTKFSHYIPWGTYFSVLRNISLDTFSQWARVGWFSCTLFVQKQNMLAGVPFMATGVTIITGFLNFSFLNLRYLDFFFTCICVRVLPYAFVCVSAVEVLVITDSLQYNRDAEGHICSHFLACGVDGRAEFITFLPLSFSVWQLWPTLSLSSSDAYVLSSVSLHSPELSSLSKASSSHCLAILSYRGADPSFGCFQLCFLLVSWSRQNGKLRHWQQEEPV